MGKKKKKRPIRPHDWKEDYLVALADKLHKVNPSQRLILNTLKDVASTFYTSAYERRICDSARFRAKHDKTVEDNWKKEQDHIDDLIHEKNQQKK